MKFSIRRSENAKKIVAEMTVEELLNQCICPYHFPENSLENVNEYGGLFIFAGKEELLAKTIKEYKEKCKIPPFIVSDFECGAGGMIHGTTAFTNMMGLSEANDPNLAYRVGEIAGKEGRNTGFNWTFGPVVDLYKNPLSPVVSVRSAGNTPEQVIKIAGNYMKGVQSTGMMAALKHFPGDGIDTYDQHLTTPCNNLSREEWFATSGRCFKELIDEGAMTIMPGHISLPFYDEVDPVLNLYPPATISKRILTDLLKGELGFEGLIVSDAFGMGGNANFKNYYEACALFLEAGGDMILFANTKDFHKRMNKYLENGTLKIETLRDRAERIISLKEQIGIFSEKEMDKFIVSSDENLKVSKEVVDKSAKLVRDREGLIPFTLKPESKILHVAVMPEEGGHYVKLINEELSQYCGSIKTMFDPGPTSIFEEIYEGNYDLVIASLKSGPDYGVSSCRIYGPIARNLMDGWMKLDTPVIFINYEDPNNYKDFEAATDTIINLYGMSSYTPKRVVEGIVGKNPFSTKIYAH